MQLQKPWASPEVVDEVLRIGREEFPHEACGVVLPDLRVRQLPNASPTSHRDSFVIETSDLVNAIRQYLDESGVDPELLTREHILVWHTHPSGQVGPSKGDIENKIEGLQYVVITMPDGPATIF